jgi:integrase
MLRKALADAVKWQLLIRNPADAADPPKAGDGAGSEMAAWSAAELRRFLEHVDGDRLASLWTLMAMTGVRRGEALGLRWKDVDLEAARISIVQTLIAVGYEVQIGNPKTRCGRRSIALDPGTVAVLRTWRSVRQRERLALGLGALADDGLVFTRAEGEHLHPGRVSKLFDAEVRRAGDSRIRLHDLRHTHASIGLAAGVNPKVMSERLGHATVSMTLDIYSHVIPGLQEDAAATVAALVRAT